MALNEQIDRPTRWDAAFDATMSDSDFALLMDRPEIKELDAKIVEERMELYNILGHYN